MVVVERIFFWTKRKIAPLLGLRWIHIFGFPFYWFSSLITDQESTCKHFCTSSSSNADLCHISSDVGFVFLCMGEAQVLFVFF